mgnify:CR=1 FL=1
MRKVFWLAAVMVAVPLFVPPARADAQGLGELRRRAEEAKKALQARKNLAAMGLQYHDAGQFLEAVKRNDALAVELFLAGRGVNVDARDAGGRGALEIARAAGNTQMARLLARPR